MDNDTRAAVMKIVKKNVKETLTKYLADRLAWDIWSEIVSGTEWDLANMGDGEKNG